MTKEAEPTISDVLEAIQGFANQTENRFERIESVMVTKDYLEKHLDEKLKNLATKDYLEKRLQQMQAHMVTKDYLDTKLNNLEGNLIVLTRKEDQKLHTLVDILHDKRVIDDNDVRRVERLEPFAR